MRAPARARLLAPWLSSLLLAAALVPAASRAAETPFEVRIDAPPAIRSALQSQLDIERWSARGGINETQLRQLYKTAPAQVRTVLATEGYFSPDVSATLDDTGGRRVVRIKVVPGEPTRVSSIDFNVTGPITEDPEQASRVQAARTEFRLAKGDVFRQADWDSTKQGVLDAVRQVKYASARIATSEAHIDPDSRSARITLVIDSGPVFRFGPLDVTGLSRYPSSIVENLDPIHPGSVYDEKLLLRFQRRLLASGYFASAVVVADDDPAHADATPVRVKIVEGAARKVDLGVGFSTDRGPRAQARYTDKNTLDRALQLSGSVKVDRLSQEAVGGLTLPTNASGHVYGLEGRYNFQDIQGEQLTNWSVTGARGFTVEKRESRQAVQFLTESIALGDGTGDDRKALYFSQTWRWNKLDDILVPRNGYFLSLELGLADHTLLTDRSFARMETHASYLLSLRKFATIILRGELGAVFANSKDNIPSAYLYRTGGDTTVRGYAYQSLGVVENGSVVGGRYLGVASVEYVQWIKPQWGAAVFVDAGNAADKVKGFQAAVGYGVGLRWSSPIGALNFDVARARDLNEWRLHFSAGMVFQ